MYDQMVTLETDILVNFGLNVLPNLAEVRPNGSAEPSVEMAEPFGFGRTAILAVRSYTTFFFLREITYSWLLQSFVSGSCNLKDLS